MQTEQYIGRFDRTEDDYAPILQFARAFAHAHDYLRYSEFDAATVGQLNLFALRENFDFDALDEALEKIIKALPAIKRIFAKPIIRLKDSGAILPVESVRVVNNATIVHASSHSELWEDITEDGLRPRKLLTINHEDDYSIYENIAFCRAIDVILQLVSRNIRILRDMLYADRDMRFNLLERENHIAYFLAIGKLHIGYVRDYEQYRERAERCLDQLMFIDRVIRARLGSPVYKKCRRSSGKFTLKKTNIFRNHKDYHRIYLLLRWFSDAKLIEAAEADALEGSDEGYRVFCSMLALFAAGHFNFGFDEERQIDCLNLNAECAFKAWKLKLETLTCGDHKAIRFTFVKDYLYRVILIPTTDRSRGKVMLDSFRVRYDAEEYLLADPVEEGNEQIYLSLYDVESFRRLQQIILRGMIYADGKRDICPFCGKALTKSDDEESGEAYECKACRTQIMHLTCPERELPYFATRIVHHRPSENASRIYRDKLVYNRYLEGQLHFRNITRIAEGERIVCPQCGKIH